MKTVVKHTVYLGVEHRLETSKTCDECSLRIPCNNWARGITKHVNGCHTLVSGILLDGSWVLVGKVRK
jgi:hypothetical protein